MSLLDRALSGGVWQLLTATSRAILQVLVIAVLARLLSPEEFGVFAIASIVISLVVFLSEAGFGPSLIFQKELSQEHLDVAFSVTLGMSLVLAIALWWSAPQIADYFGRSDVADIIRAVSVSVPLSVFGNVSKSLLEKRLQFRTIMWINTMAYAVGYALFAIVLAFLGYGVWALVAASIAEIVLLSLAYFAVSPHKIRLRFSGRHFAELFRFGSGQTLGQFFNFVSSKADLFVVSKALPAELVGVYERILRIVDLPARYSGTLIGKVLFPAMAQIQSESKKLKAVYLSGIVFVNGLLLPFTVFLILATPEVVLILLGPNWVAGIIPMQILLLTTALRTTVSLSDSLMRAVGAVYQGAWRKAVVAVFVAVGSFVGVRWGLVGVAIALNAAVLTRYLLMAQLGMRITGATVAEFAIAHLPGIVLATLVLLSVSPLLVWMRGLGIASFLVLTSALITAMLVALSCLFLFPRIIGPNGRWLMSQLSTRSSLARVRMIRQLARHFS